MIDLDKFPISPTGKRMLSRVSPIYANAYVMKWLYQIMGEEMDTIWGRLAELPEQAFTQTVTWGIDYQEDKYSIQHDYSMTLEERREQLRRRKPQKRPISPGAIEQWVKESYGLDIDVDETTGAGIFTVTVAGTNSQEKRREMFWGLYRRKPSHLQMTANVSNRATGILFIGACPQQRSDHTLMPEASSGGTASAVLYIGAVANTQSTYDIYPERGKDTQAGISLRVNVAPYMVVHYEI
jgi:hypothetical protein